jgi:hypothetical protein
MELPDLAKMAKPLDDKLLPNVFLGELQEFNWALEECKLANGRPGIRLVIMPALLPFIKFALPFHISGLEKLFADIAYALEQYQGKNGTSN